MNILQVNKADISGGAERVARGLMQKLHDQGQVSQMAVADKTSDDMNVLEIPAPECLSRWMYFWHGVQTGLLGLSPKMHGVGFWRASRIVPWLANPLKAWARFRGREDFRYPGFCHILSRMPIKPDIIHCHNLHGEYFDLRALPSLSHSMPVMLTLHDMWMLTGHCAHSFECGRWKIGCGHCPDLTIYPAVTHDATACNWRFKQKLYQDCRLYVASPSRWLMEKIQQSILMPGIVECRIIPNGVDLEVFNSRGRADARKRLDIQSSSRVLLFSANRIKNNPWKDYEMLKTVLSEVEKHDIGKDVLFIALGNRSDCSQEKGQTNIRFVSFQNDEEIVALYYKAADVYVHAAKADTFPLAVLEALACGTPVVATAVGGITEQVIDGVTGYLVPTGNSRMMAERVIDILNNDDLKRTMGRKAEEYSLKSADINSQVGAYNAWYQEIIGRKPLKLLIDGEIYGLHHGGGISRVFNELIPRLSRLGVDLKVGVKQYTSLDRIAPDVLPFVQWIPQISPNMRPWRMWARLRRVINPLLGDWFWRFKRSDIFMSSYYTNPPVKACKKVCVVHDLIFHLFPESFEAECREDFLRKQHDAIMSADRIISVSDNTRRDMTRLCGIPEYRSQTIYNGGGAINTFQEKVVMHQKPYLLYVGDFRCSYKNFNFILSCLGSPVGPDIDRFDLIVVSHDNPNSAELAIYSSYLPPSRLRFVNSCTDKDLASYYMGCEALIYPSLYEGFGLPVQEALSFGTPVVCSCVASLPEVGGDAVYYFDPHSAGQFQGALKAAITAGRSPLLVAKRQAQAAQFSWDKAAREYLEVFKDISQS